MRWVAVLAVLLVMLGSVSGLVVKTVPQTVKPEEDYGKIIYFPTKHNAERSIENQLPNGAIAESKSIETTVMAGRLLELAVMYHYTKEDKYKTAYEKGKRFLQRLYEEYRIYPELATLDGYALSFKNNTFVQDAIKAGDLLVYKQEMPELEFEETLKLKCSLYTGEEGRINAEQVQCPYLLEYEVKYGNKTMALICNASDSNTVKVKYRIKPEALFKEKLEPNDVIVEETWVVLGDEEREVSVDEGVLRGIQLHVINKGVNYFRNEFARKAFDDPDFVRGLEGNEPRNLKQEIGFQFRRVLYNKGEGKEYMLRYAGKISLLKGYIYFPRFYVNYSLDYTIPVKNRIIKEIRDGFDFQNGIIYHRGNLKLEGSVLKLDGIDFSKPQTVSVRILFYKKKDTVEFRAHNLKDYFDRKVVSVNETPYARIFYYYFKNDWENITFEASELLCRAVNEDPSLLHFAVTNYLADNPNSRYAMTLYKAMATFDESEIKKLPDEIRLPNCTISKVKLVRAFDKYKQIYKDFLYEYVKEKLYEAFLEGKDVDVSALIKEAEIINERRALELLRDYEKAKHNSTEYERYRDFLRHYYPDVVSAIEEERYAEALKLAEKINESKAKRIFLDELNRRKSELRKKRDEIIAKIMTGNFSVEKDIEEYLNELEKWGERDREMEKIYALLDSPELLKQFLGIAEQKTVEKFEKLINATKPVKEAVKPVKPKKKLPLPLIGAVLLILLAAAFYLAKRGERRR